MYLNENTIKVLRRTLRAFQNVPVHETAIVQSLMDEHGWPEVATTAPLHMVSCASLGMFHRWLGVLPDAAVPFLRVAVEEAERGSAMIQNKYTAECAPIAKACPMLFPANIDRLQHHMAHLTKPVNRPELGRKLFGHIRKLVTDLGYNENDIPVTPDFNRVLTRQVYFGTTLAAPSLYGFLVHTTEKEFSALMRTNGKFKSACRDGSRKDNVRQAVAQLMNIENTSPVTVRLVLLVKALGF